MPDSRPDWRVAATLPPLCPVPDPPNGPPLYAVQPQFQSTCHQPLSPPYSGLDQHVHRRFPDADYHLWKPEYQPLHPMPLPDRSLHLINHGLVSYSQPRNSHAEYRQLQQEYQTFHQVPPPQSHRCSPAPLLAAVAPPSPPAPMVPPCSPDDQRISSFEVISPPSPQRSPPLPATVGPSSMKDEISEVKDQFGEIKAIGEIHKFHETFTHEGGQHIIVICKDRIAALILYVFKQYRIWNYQMKFKDIFDVDYFIQYLKTVSNEDYNWTERSYIIDPGGFIDTRRCFVVSTLRARWISTAGELIRAYLSSYLY